MTASLQDELYEFFRNYVLDCSAIWRNMASDLYLLTYRAGNVTRYEKWRDFCEEEAWYVASCCCYNLYVELGIPEPDELEFNAYFLAEPFKREHNKLDLYDDPRLR